ncbi:hypothetical protein FQN54_006620 [Arachnomyces sp. PD_36]|nr:hypothetical protein FQN54_006620 [Arachnomyces sp. PD_36]
MSGDDITIPDISPSSFAKLMALRQISAEEPLASVNDVNGNDAQREKIVTFRSLAKPFSPGVGERAFGGHVYAQAAYAASKTVGEGFCLHNITGSFTLPGRLDIPFTYSVRCVRDGGMYALRTVDVRQPPSSPSICFTCICSFKRAETKANPHFSHQPRVDIFEKYHAVLGGKGKGKGEGRIEDHHPLAPSADVRYWTEAAETGDVEEDRFPGTEVRKVDMRAYNESEEVNARERPEEYRQLQFYRIIGSPGGADDDEGVGEREEERDQRGEFDNLYACAHLYASDKNSLFVITKALGSDDYLVQMGSLSHTVVFHTGGEGLRMVDWSSGEAKKKWFVQEASTSTSGENRGLHESRIWGPDGRLVATTLQDGQVKMRGGGGKGMRKLGKL